ncbi:copper/silver-translocating P-type ATPase,heavy metal-translocating P-type ATPase, Cd/Co/Hg/Pb/Zn-transporting [Owenweeksia hongkongensis DSM 17368]|uniref:Copper/silver-translocating P-type ATPase,heavy metal-translocating P-type ATPase, Cd/Co/Hg/Pb/Zn-transporting n=1 Tax=Owenweeksia hongkongensis (strain DSM 17368 / CIP 108786 / JCM 12287 / NRRL B-23963 / UST20020801) TaxID=926562 RepID=G8QZR3_OWEHD|nr:copper-translocating P-type ATPase [Owenweeksia hongkongensis]AEV31507.1 copper/silver-translocating P-type ATPase,heavy metal-translocating P-type ATPase, Cd/Co/Hg/Pb/Zn-transporting [Owenweeksia hongkongensis DSM 17368]
MKDDKVKIEEHGHHKHHDMEHDHSDHHHEGHDHNAMINDFKKRLWICLVLTVPVLLFSPMLQDLLGFSISFMGMTYVSVALATIIYVYGGWPFLKGLVSDLKAGGPGMMTLIAIAISVAWVYSTAVSFGLSGKVFYWELVTLIDIMLLGHWLEMKSVMGASKALEKLAQLMPASAHLMEGNETKEVKINDLKKGDLILIKPGEKIPADGRIKEGHTELNESALTGESKAVEKTTGDKVIGGSINGDGALKVEVTTAGEDSYLKKVIKLVEEAQKTKSKTQNLADKAAGWLAYIALASGVMTLVAWLTLSNLGFDFALERMVTVMIITCPHALGLAVPLVVAISTALSAKNGLLIRNRTAFENSRKIDAIVFDKTGTLTEGNFGVNRVEVLKDGMSESDFLKIVAAIEGSSEHPIAKGIVKEAKARELELPSVSDFKAEKGKGVMARVNGGSYAIVSPGYLEGENIDIPKNAFNEDVETVVFVLKDKELIGFVSLADQIREESRAAIEQLKEVGIKVYMATGDNEQTAKAVAGKLSLDGYYSEVLPHEKSEIIEKLQSEGHFVAMTGDGVNDAPALAKAEVGIAVGSGTDVAAETADIILTESSPKDISRLILFGRATYKKMVQNLVWATGYNVVAIPLAAGVLYQQGIMISPAIGAALMSLSTIICAVNAQLLRRSLK